MIGREIEAADRLIVLGNASEDAGNLQEACTHYRKAVAVAPRYGRAHLNLGIGLEASGEVDGAIAAFEAAIATDPASANARYNLGRLLYSRGMLMRAAELLRSSLTHRPDFPDALVVLSSVYDAQGDLDAAATELKAALALRPDWDGVLLNYGIVLKKLGRLDEAEAALRRALEINDANVTAGQVLAGMLLARGALPEAENVIRRALRHQPEFPEAEFTLSDVYEAQGNLSAAAAALERALKLRPDWAGALNNYGMILQRLQRLEEAEAALRRAIALAPRLSAAYQTLGSILVNQCRLAEALEVFRMGRQQDPPGFNLESAELFVLNLCEDISSEALCERHKAFGTRLETACPARFFPFRNVKDPERRLRIGYVSSDFCNHGVALFTLPLIERHDRAAHEILCYSVGTIEDEFTRALRSRADEWRHAAASSDAELADLINHDEIDILVDLAGHSGRRLPVFAQQPAPLQVSWLGYLGTTGMTRIQYRLCDPYTDPSGAERFHTETLVRLPTTQWCYRPRTSIDYASPAVTPFGKNGYVTFGSFNHVPKLSSSILTLWAQILINAPDSRLVLVGVPDGKASDGIAKHFADAGVDPMRIKVVGRVSIQEYFRWFNAVDIALDTTPYSGGTTTCDALFAGVPVLTVPGSRPVSRSGAGILSAVGLTEWIASSPEDYVARAVEFARRGAARAAVRETVRQRMRDSPIMDEAGFVHGIEDAYRRIWRAYCQGGEALAPRAG